MLVVQYRFNKLRLSFKSKDEHKIFNSFLGYSVASTVNNLSVAMAMLFGFITTQCQSALIADNEV